MKSIKNKSKILLFSFIMAIGITACNTDDETVVPKTLEQYKLELSDIISSEKVEVENCVVGYNKGDFKVASQAFFVEYTTAYMDSLLAAEEVLAKTDLTIADIVDANEAITVPGENFNDNRFLSDRRPLNDVIAICDTLVAHTPEGTEVGQCPAEPRNAFRAAISAAKTVRGAGTTIDRQVTEAVDKLNLALTVFEEAIIK
jgi:hypothetical protein